MAFFSAIASLIYAITTLGLNTDENDLFAAQLEFVELRAQFYANLPALADPIIIVLDSGSDPSEDRRVGRASAEIQLVAQEFARAIEQDPTSFNAVSGVVDDGFERRHGLLLVGGSKLKTVLSKINSAQPLLGFLSKNPSLGGLLELTARLFDNALESSSNPATDGMLDRTETYLNALALDLHAWRDGQSLEIEWRELFSPAPGAQARPRTVFFVSPVVDFNSLDPAGPAIEKLRSIGNSMAP